MSAPAEGKSAHAGGDALAAATRLRAEAEHLRQRAEASVDPVIRDAYRELVSRWSNFAALLEMRVLEDGIDALERGGGAGRPGPVDAQTLSCPSASDGEPRDAAGYAMLL